ncbi:hypothetical protein ADIS_1115 [Lunatimonas lonarensis]|uniref:Uncharacterized protein n=1 Tax=Lunatimonas lonarensis TaxID=1232681 RepID=R7ZVZ0_9BACT|nr:hypothetical protein ADIS_1115 [Lunatimonas lonarensis]
MIEAQSLIEPLNRHFWVGAVGSWLSFFTVHHFILEYKVKQ